MPRLFKATHQSSLMPRVCSEDCEQFARRNPAYAQLDNRGHLLFQHAAELLAKAYTALGKQQILDNPPQTAAMQQYWQNALEVATEIDAKKQFQDLQAEIAVSRAMALDNEKHLDEAISLLKTATQLLGKHDQIITKLVELLTDSGVKAGNESRWDDAITALREALEINPHAPRTRTNLVIALRGQAASARQKAHPLLEEACQILKAGLKIDQNNKEWKRKLAELLTDIGVKAGNESRWDDAITALREALEIDTHAPRTRTNLVTALRGKAASHFRADQNAQARSLLEEARQILETGLEMDEENKEWESELLDVKREIEVSTDDDEKLRELLLETLFQEVTNNEDAEETIQALLQKTLTLMNMEH